MPFASLPALPLWNALHIQALTRIPIDGITFAFYVLPPLVCYVVAAVLAVTPHTRTLRLSFWSLVALLALRAALTVDLSFGRIGFKFINSILVLSMTSIAVHSLGWALAKEPLVRHLRPSSSSSSTVMDAFDLAANVRGHGWGWSHPSYIPRETRPTNRMAFVLYASLSAVAHALLFAVLFRAVQTLVKAGVSQSNPQRSTIFDDALPALVQYLRALLISTSATTWLYAASQMAYDLCTVPAILILKQDPAQWPPAFDAPWCATSLSAFWGHKWHQFLRRTFFLLGGYPLSLVFGRAGVVVGAFLASAVLHHAALLTLDSQMEFRWMLAGFGMMAPGILAERAFHHLTGRRVGGVLGWVWTMYWMLIWGTVIVEGFARGGMFVCSDLFDSLSPLRSPVERLTIDFDAWLHTF